MTFIQEILHNPLFVAPALAWTLAQGSKTVLYTVINKQFDPERLTGGGGMPSSHSATVCALAAAAGMHYGAGGFEFPMAVFFAFIVMYDAMGVRRETGKQAQVINDIVDEIRKMNSVQDFSSEEVLKEFVGHTPLQVAVGAILGIIVGILVAA